MDWNLVFFQTPRGEKPVKEFIKDQELHTRVKISHTLNLLERYGAFLGMPHARRVANNLFELRVRGKQEVRIFYTSRKQTIYLLHAFKKQTPKTPRKELETALNRLDII